MEIILIYFLLSVVITFIILYVINPNPYIIMKYPTINKKKSDLYIDDKNVCYRYHAEETKCKI
jgi:hypothetical protein